MNVKRAIGGFALSFVFLAFFAYAIFGLQQFLSGFLFGQNKSSLSASIFDAAQNSAPQNASNVSPQTISALKVNAASAISIWADNPNPDKVLFSKNVDTKLSIASISKLMTALVVIDNYDLSQQIVISDKAANQTIEPDQLKAGEKFYVKDLLYAMLIGSDNTASYALSEGVPLGSDINKFVDLMNEKATELGLSNTSFSNPTGLGLSNFSTVQDLIKFSEYLLKNHPSILGITTMPEFDLYTVDGKTLHKIINTDELLNDSSGLVGRIIGGKTGDTKTAGECLLLVVKPIDRQGYFINVILNSDDRFGEMKKIINWADTTYQR